MKLAFLHNLPLEYYPPATNFLDLIGCSQTTEVRAFSSRNMKGREDYENAAIKIRRAKSPKPQAIPVWRMLVVFWWHVKTALSIAIFKPDAIVYIEPHSAIGAWIYYRLLGGEARLFIHHHEYYSPEDYDRPGMRIPRLGFGLEQSYLFPKAEWISQTNPDRLSLAKKDNPSVPDKAWHVLPNYPPKDWVKNFPLTNSTKEGNLTRLIYVGSASFEDTYIEEIVRWVAAYPRELSLHICGYNVAAEVWEWLDREQFSNVSFNSDGYNYADLPQILEGFDIGLVLYKGNTTNFIYNVPNKVFEYLLCRLAVWYPVEMVGIRNFQTLHALPLQELSFSELESLNPIKVQSTKAESFSSSQFTSEQACKDLFAVLGVFEPS